MSARSRLRTTPPKNFWSQESHEYDNRNLFLDFLILLNQRLLSHTTSGHQRKSALFHFMNIFYQVIVLIVQAKLSDIFHNHNGTQFELQQDINFFITNRLDYIRHSNTFPSNLNSFLNALIYFLKAWLLPGTRTHFSDDTKDKSTQTNNHTTYRQKYRSINTKAYTYRRRTYTSRAYFRKSYRPHFSNPNSNNSFLPKNRINKRCYRCKQFGHLIRSCTTPLAN